MPSPERTRVTVLFLLMEFAPVNTTGNFRSLKFIKYLEEYGIDPVVVTFLENEGASIFNAQIDEQLLNDIPLGTKIYRIHCEDGQRYYRNKLRAFVTIYFSVKDNLAARWREFLMPRLDKIIEEHHPTLIFTSLPPFSSGDLAVELSRKFSLPLVVDMRDLYARLGNTPFGSRIHYWLTLLEERRIFRSSKAIIGVTPRLLEVFKSSHPTINSSKFEFIPNGFDGDSNAIDDFAFSANQPGITIGYVGSFYYQPEIRKQFAKQWWRRSGHKKFYYTPIKEDWLYRSPYFFLRAIAQLLVIHPHLEEVIKIEFVGREPTWLKEMIAEFGLQNLVTMHGFVSQVRAIEIQQGFDVLLATSEKVVGEEHYCLPSKIFDYVGLSKPVVGFVTEGIQKDFILNSGIGIICDPDNATQSAEKIGRLFFDGAHFKINKEYLRQFERKSTAGKLASLLREHSTTLRNLQ